MNILLINTVSERLSVGIYSDGKIFRAKTDAAQRDHSAMINRCVEEAKKAANIGFSELDAYACVVGPGSFTGIRVGIATAKGYAAAQKRPFIAVNSLELAAYNITDGEVAMDAGRGRVYFAKISGGNLVLPIIMTENRETEAVYDPKYDYIEEFGSIAAEKYLKNEFSTRFSPVYVQLCQAENEYFARHEGLVIRKATVGDVWHILSVEERCFNDEAWTAEMFLSELEEPIAGVFVAIKDATIAGFAEFRFDGEQLYLGNVGVHPDFRRKGIARDLLTKTISDYCEKGAKSCFLHVRKSNSAAIGLYESLGFSVVREIQNYYPKNESALAMIKYFE